MNIQLLDPDASSFVTLRSSAIYNPLLNAAAEQKKKKRTKKKKQQMSDEDEEGEPRPQEITQEVTQDMTGTKRSAPAANNKRSRAPVQSRPRKAARPDQDQGDDQPEVAKTDEDPSYFEPGLSPILARTRIILSISGLPNVAAPTPSEISALASPDAATPSSAEAAPTWRDSSWNFGALPGPFSFTGFL